MRLSAKIPISNLVGIRSTTPRGSVSPSENARFLDYLRAFSKLHRLHCLELVDYCEYWISQYAKVGGCGLPESSIRINRQSTQKTNRKPVRKIGLRPREKNRGLSVNKGVPNTNIALNTLWIRKDGARGERWRPTVGGQSERAIDCNQAIVSNYLESKF